MILFRKRPSSLRRKHWNTTPEGLPVYYEVQLSQRVCMRNRPEATQSRSLANLILATDHGTFEKHFLDGHDHDHSGTDLPQWLLQRRQKLL